MAVIGVGLVLHVIASSGAGTPHSHFHWQRYAVQPVFDIIASTEAIVWLFGVWITEKKMDIRS